MTETITTFQPSFMQKLLGRNYKWWYFIIYNLKSSLAYRSTAIFLVVRDLIPLFISLTIYGSFLESKDFLIYFLLGNLFFKFITLFADVIWGISSSIKYGSLSNNLLLPTAWLNYKFFSVIGGNFFTVFLNFTTFILLIFFYQLRLSLSLNFLLLLPSLIIAVIIYFCTDLIVASVTFWTPETEVLIEIKTMLLPLLSGALIFLNTNQVTNSFANLPWSYLVHHPMQIYLGKYSPLETLYVFLGGIAWCVVLYFLAKWVFKMGLKRNESVGL